MFFSTISIYFLIRISSFKAYDIRGQLPHEINSEIAYRIGNATAEYLSAKKIILRSAGHVFFVSLSGACQQQAGRLAAKQQKQQNIRS